MSVETGVARRREATRMHTAVARLQIALLLAILLLLGAAMLLRALHCGSAGRLWIVYDYLCNFRAVALTALVLDGALLYSFMWHAARYDTDDEPIALRHVSLRPMKLIKASGRAARRRDTPHRKKFILAALMSVALVAAFVWLVLFSEFIFW
jgi:hypothetical protein